jgi:OmpA-OmpF porin, OOP family
MYTLTSRTAHIVWSQLAIATTLAFATQVAVAQTAAPMSNSALGQGSTYIGLSIGSSDFSKPSNGFGIFGNDQRATAYSINMGNYFFSPNFGMEVGYTDFGSVNRAGGTTKIDGINVSLIGRAPMSSTFNLLGKIGTTYGRTDVSSAPTSGVTAGSERGFDWSYGIGAEMLLSPQWSGVLQYDEHYVKFPGGSTDRVSATSLGLRYRY